MNEHGLFFDTYQTPARPAVYKGMPFFKSDDPDYYDYALWSYCLAKCSTISEVLGIYDQYDQWWQNDVSSGQLFFVDKNGDSLIIEDCDTIIYKEGDFQVVTNYLQSQPRKGGYPCWRYDTAVSMLENMTGLSVDYFKSICNATHVRTSVFSNVYDLKLEKLYVHYYYDYENIVEFDLNEELAKGKNSIYLGSLFEPEGNQGPSKPEAPTGNESGSPGEEYEFTLRKVKDPDGDLVSYKWDWGDGTYSFWIPAPPTGIYLSANHNWSEEGTYELRVKAMDMYGNEGEWSDPLVVSMPKEKSNLELNTWLIRLIKRFPILKLVI
jgi:hypothetical protein